jgi:NADH:ubiquinone oxidoreductase subunit F (NADH-binding)
VAPDRFVSGEESAVASRLSGGAALPRSKPPRVFESGVHGHPTLVSNVETLAHLAVAARDGAEAIRAYGTADQPGTMLFTVSGAVYRPAVVEAAVGITVADLIETAGGASHHVRAVLVGGYHGGWLPWPEARDVPLSNAALRRFGLAVGAGVLVVLPADACPLRECARVLDYLANESAGQCGPCVFGMPRLASAYRDVVVRRPTVRRRNRLEQLADALARRGGCSHPDGSLRFVRSAIDVFAAELSLHRRDRCSAISRRPVLPTPGITD